MSVVVTANAMATYRETLRKISDKAADEVQQYMLKHKFTIDDDFIDFAYAIATKYGEAAGALSCEFYDFLVDYWKAARAGEKAYQTKFFRPAEPARTATYGETAKTVHGVALQTKNEEVMANAVGRLVRLVGIDTIQQNAIRDGAEWAWIPRGDTCAFCLALASNGWQPASKKALKNGHAEHVHSNCDCVYVVRFDDETEVEGYDPEEYEELYDESTGTPEEKINYMRRQFYAENKDKINAQKRSAYEKRKELNSSAAEEFNAN